MSEPSDGPVLILAPTGRDGTLAAQTLERAGIAAQVFRDLGALAAAISSEVGAVVLAHEALVEANLDSVRARLAAQEPWSDLPVLLLTTAGENRGHANSEATAILAPASFVTLLERPFRTATLVSAVEAALRARRRQWQLRDLLWQQRANERALYESEERLRVATESAGVGTWDLSPGNGRLMWNDQCRAHFGLRPGEPVNLDRFYAGIHPEDRASTEEAVNGALDPSGPGRYAVEFRTVGPHDGSLRWISATGRAVFDQARRPARFSGTTVDITERKHALLSLERTKDELEAANDAKDHFLAMLSHELRTPLTPVLLCLAGRAGDDTLPADLRDDLAMIRRCVELEARLIDDLLDLTRVARGKLELHAEPGDAHAIVRAAVEICAAGDDARSRPPVELRLEAREHHVQADRARLQQVFWNLINNALKFTPDGGRVAVRTHNPRPGCLALEVRDEGIGIAPGRIGELFGAFKQGGRAVTRRFGGLGLGLAISKALVDLHGGQIFATSEGIGHGSVFTVELDTRATPPSEAARAPAGEPGEARPLRVLLVEDNAPTLSALSRLLRRAGHEVRTASSLGEAREVMEDDSFDLLLSDLGLPDGSGIDLVREGGGRLPPTRIALSGYGMESDVRACLDAGFQTHVTKPVDWPRLVQIMREFTATPTP